MKNFIQKSRRGKLMAVRVRWRRLLHYLFKDMAIPFSISNGLSYYAYSDWVGTDRVISERFDIEEVAFLGLYLKEGMICMDVGAHYGFYTLQMARAVKERGKVISCEPSEKNRERLIKNVLLNRFKQVKVLPVAVSNKDGEATLFHASHNTGENTLSVRNEANYSSWSKVAMYTLDTIVSETLLEKLDFIKIDIENHEYEALEGAIDTIKLFHPTILIELWEAYSEPWGSQLNLDKSITKFLTQLDYKWFSIDKTGHLIAVEDGEVRMQNNYVAAHKSKLNELPIRKM